MARLPEHWTIFDVTTSTNDTIHEAAQRGEPEGTVHLAHCQTRGRGRVGRTWWCEPDRGLLMSVLLRPRTPIARAGALSLLAGKAVTEALQPLVRENLSLYWPNDVYVGHDRKLGGILGEIRGTEAAYWIALGIGVNVSFADAEVPRELSGRVAALDELGCGETDPVVLARRVTASFWPLYDRFQNGETLEILVTEELAHVGRDVTVHGVAAKPLQGRVVGLGEGGELLVLDAWSVVHRVLAGDVVYEISGRSRFA